MKYFRIRHSLDNKIVGNYSQVEKAKYSCNINDDNFIDKVFFTKATFTPITAKAILLKKAKLTDLISAYCIGFTAKLLMSGRLKKILENHRKTGIEFFNSPIIFNDREIEDYWVLNIYETNEEYINYQKSEILLRSRRLEGGTELSEIRVASLMDFKEKAAFFKKEKKGRIFVSKMMFGENINRDFFVLRSIEGGIGYFVSETVKQEIEEAGCTGIEFQPTHLSFNEWLARGGEREKVYGKS